MPLQEDFYQLRSNTTQQIVFEETPIFIGTASKLVQITTKDGSKSLDVPETENGLKYRHDFTEADVTYWETLGIYFADNIDTSRTVLSITPIFEYKDPDLSKYQYSCFIVDPNTEEIIFTAGLSKVEFLVNSPTEKSLASITLQEKIPPTLDVVLHNYNIYIALISIAHFDSSKISNINNSLTIIDNESIHLVNATNINSLILIDWNLYYDVIDYRYCTLLPSDIIPDYFISNKHNQLGATLNRHQIISTTSATLFSIPSQTIENFQTALAKTEELGNDLGYFIVPLFVDLQLGMILKEYCKNMELDYIWSYGLITSLPYLSKSVGQGSVSY